MGIYFAMRILPQMFTFLSAVPVLRQQESYFGEITGFIIILLILAVSLFVICYLFMYKRERLASVIVGKDEFPEPDIQIQWLPVAFRLICIFAGVYCLYNVISTVIVFLVRYFQLKSYSANATLGYYFNITQIIGWCLMLIIGIYLICGAPRFVRWQVKKTLELCKNQKGIKTYSSS